MRRYLCICTSVGNEKPGRGCGFTNDWNVVGERLPGAFFQGNKLSFVQRNNMESSRTLTSYFGGWWKTEVWNE